jgi:hypothetical protein
MTTTSPVQSRPAWLTDVDELPHAPVDMPQWSENYLSYVYSPASEVGIWFHLSHISGSVGVPGLWEEVLFITLPGDRCVAARSFARGRIEEPQSEPVRGGLSVSGITFRCEEPFTAWTKKFFGGARHVTGAEMREGPLADGPHTLVDLELHCSMMSPPFDYGTGNLDQSWAIAHYEQHQEVTGRLRVGDRTFEIAGAGMRDHSWGPRDWTKMGRTTWIQGQFPDSGRAFMTVFVAERLPHYPEALSYTVISDRTSVTQVQAHGIPEAFNLTQTEHDADFVITMPDGRETTVHTQILAPMRMHLHGDTEFALGTANRHGPHASSHDYTPAFAAIEWDGEVGYGYVERTAELF